MTIILGSMTTVDIDGVVDGFQSISWNTQVQNTKLWSIGQWVPWTTQVSTTETVNVTSYAGVLSTLSLTPSTGCEDSGAQKTVTINPTSCGGPVTGITNDTFFVTSYSYSKGDPNGFGTESWSLQRWIDSTDLNVGTPGEANSVVGQGAPNFILQGISEGTYSNDGMTVLEVGVNGGTLGSPSTQGSVSAGFPGLGNVTVVENVTQPSSVGSGAVTVPAGGGTGQSSISIPHQPLFV